MALTPASEALESESARLLRELEAAEVYEQKRRQRELKQLARRAQKLGYTLAAVPATTPESQGEGGGNGRF